MKPTNSIYVGGPPLDPPDDDEDMRCPYCFAYHTNEFAAAYHFKICQARNSQTEPSDD